MYVRMLLVGILSAAIPVIAQVAPSASEGAARLNAGIGYSNYATDWQGRLGGTTLWITWEPYRSPRLLRGLGLEVEEHDLHFGRYVSHSNLRIDTLGGGVIYKWRHYPAIHPYAKCLVGLGSIDFNIGSPSYSHDTRTIYVTGGGAEYRIWRSVWVRADYEYESWTDFFHHNALNPQGATIGISHNLRHSDRH